MIVRDVDKPRDFSPPLVTDRKTLESLPLLYRAIAEKLVETGRIVIQEDGEGRPVTA